MDKKEIFYHIVNSGLAGALVFLGSISSGKITWAGAGTALIAATIVAVTKFKNFWESEQPTTNQAWLNFL